MIRHVMMIRALRHTFRQRVSTFTLSFPGLVQHFGAYRSTFNNPGAVGGIPRNSKTYDNQFDVESVDWESEFKNPYLAKSSKDWVKEIVNKEFLDEYKKL